MANKNHQGAMRTKFLKVFSNKYELAKWVSYSKEHMDKVTITLKLKPHSKNLVKLTNP